MRFESAHYLSALETTHVLKHLVCFLLSERQKAEEYSRYVFDHPWLKDTQQLASSADGGEQGPLVSCMHVHTDARGVVAFKSSHTMRPAHAGGAKVF